ncbi:MAG TPA: molybdopterin-binding protein [Corynebacteriales bacterium]|jgi:molybdenum cofactor synthesis domain-containing protein|nr:molybdopterin-binding protein [Mycobacteriales bacterium]
MKKVKIADAVGMILCHDITKIVPNEFKGRALTKGHIIQEEDIPELLAMGKEHIYVWEDRPGTLHENDAATRIAEAIRGPNITIRGPEEGKCTFASDIKGLFEVNRQLLQKINSIPMVSVATLPNNFPVNIHDKIAGARVVPLTIAEKAIIQVEEVSREYGAAIRVTPYQKLKAGVVVTGSEVYKGRITDRFGPVIEEKLAYFDSPLLEKVLVTDNTDQIKTAILELKALGADIIIVTGGMSVDPDDLTPCAIGSTGASIVTYGAPVQPGNMFMLAYLDGTVIMGVPGCSMYMKTTILDAVLPRAFAGHTLTKADFVAMGEGGFCRGCKVCRYPTCFFCRS